MKKKIYATLLWSMSISVWSGISAQEAVKTFEHLAVGVEVSTTGLGLELATPLHNNFGLRGGISFLPYNYPTTFKVNVDGNFKNKFDNVVDLHPDVNATLIQQGLPTKASDINTDIDATATLNFFNGKILVDYYPMTNQPFHITAGVYIGNSEPIKLKGKMKSNQVFDVLNVLKDNGIDYFNESFVVDQEKGYQLTVNDLMDISGTIKINSVKPYLGFGFGREAPKSRVGLNFELGVFYEGTPKLTCSNSNIQKLVNDKITEVSDVFNKLSVYPVISLKLNLKIF